MSYESVNKIKSLQQNIESFTGKSYSDLTSAVQELKNGYGSSEGGSGIIDVTELPTENIDENAVYRVTENIQVEKNEIYIGAGEGAVTISQYLASLGVPTIPNIYAVDELPSDMKVSDVQTFSELHFYILKSDGITYLNVPAYGGVITVGLFGFQAMGYDKGFTENIYDETEQGVYTTLEAYKQVVRWFTRENGGWKEITSYTETTKRNGVTNIDILSGDITDKVFSAVDVISCEIEELDERWFVRRDGSFVESIREYKFAFSGLKRATIPHFITFVGYRAFNDNKDLTVVTFKGKLIKVDNNAFDSCDNLTTINVPWSEGEVVDAPWGATNATINYNYTGE